MMRISCYRADRCIALSHAGPFPLPGDALLEPDCMQRWTIAAGVKLMVRVREQETMSMFASMFAAWIWRNGLGVTRTGLFQLLMAVTAVAQVAVAQAATAQAAELTVMTTDPAGQPLPHAVIALRLDSGLPTPRREPRTLILDQKDEVFRPHVAAAQAGDRLDVANNDRARHHVYSFSPLAKFAAVLPPRMTAASEAVKLDNVGEIAIGCNLHDQMLAYVVVLDTPLFGVSDAAGRTAIPAPAGRYQMTVWHPRADGWSAPAPLVLNDGPATVQTIAVAVRPKDPASFGEFDPESGFADP
jgi:plastocyanin